MTKIHAALREIAESYGILALQLEWLQKLRAQKPPEPTPRSQFAAPGDSFAGCRMPAAPRPAAMTRE